MISWFINLNYVLKALIATTFTFLVTALGAGIVYFFKNINKLVMDMMLGSAAGIMLAASYFSLLAPAILACKELSITTYILPSLGFIFGGVILYITDKVFDKIMSKKEKRVFKLVSSITIHNIPEGLAVGVAFGSVAYHINGATLLSAVLLTIGIGLQNFPEGSAISLPLMRDGMSKRKAFIIGSLSAVVEPIFGIIGAYLVVVMRLFMPFFLSFAAGAMIYVVITELVPESQASEKKDLMALASIVGFTIMMVLDVALG